MTTFTTTLNAHDCPTCGVVYGLTTEFQDRKRDSGESWRCPNGHSVVYRKSNAQLEKEARQRAEREAEAARMETRAARRQLADEQDRHQGTARRLSATRGVVTRTKNRVGRGVCPCCTRTFTNLARHMKSKHPTYATEPTE